MIENKDNFTAEVLKKLDNFTIPQLTEIAEAIEIVLNDFDKTSHPNLAKVAQFHSIANHPIDFKPLMDFYTVEKLELAQLRVDLIVEEAQEFIDAIKTNNTVEAFDALLDLEYVVLGAHLALGFTSIAKEGFDEVHKSNMSKLCSSAEEAEATKTHYLERYSKGNTPFTIDIQEVKVNLPEGEKLMFRVVRNDGKMLKNINYSPARLEEIVINQHLKLF
jgi:predicted HAD superfamily Cof-like phosphohydrolase